MEAKVTEAVFGVAGTLVVVFLGKVLWDYFRDARTLAVQAKCKDCICFSRILGSEAAVQKLERITTKLNEHVNGMDRDLTRIDKIEQCTHELKRTVIKLDAQAVHAALDLVKYQSQIATIGDHVEAMSKNLAVLVAVVEERSGKALFQKTSGEAN